MIEPDATSAAAQPADPDRRRDNFTGPPVTAAELALLERLAFIGGELAEATGRRAKARLAEEEALLPTDPAAARAAGEEADHDIKKFEHLSRMVRLTIGLKGQLSAALEKWRQRQDGAASEQDKSAERQRRADLKQKVGEVLEEIVRATQGDKPAASAIRRTNRWFAERDHEAGLPDLPLGEIIALIARDFGVEIDFKQWQDRDWAEAAAAALPSVTVLKIERTFIGSIELADGETEWLEVGRTIGGKAIMYADIPPDASAETAFAAAPEDRGYRTPAQGPPPPEELAELQAALDYFRQQMARARPDPVTGRR